MRRRLKEQGTDSTLDTFAQMQFHEEKLRDEMTTDAAMVITDEKGFEMFIFSRYLLFCPI